MKVRILVADAARMHPDGTFSVLRAGIDQIRVRPGNPNLIQGSLVIRFVPGEGDEGSHEFAIRLTDSDGELLGGEVKGQFSVQDVSAGTQIVSDFQIVVPSFGSYLFSVLVDDQEKDSWPIHVREGEPQ